MRNVVVTGAGGGLGRVTAELFSNAGDHVFGCDADADAVLSLGKAVGYAELVDVGVQSQVDQFFARVWSKCEQIDVLINNVGVAGPMLPLESVPPEEWFATLNANLNGAYWTTRRVLGAMKARKMGCILNVSSVSARTFPRNRSPYNVSKAALEALTLSIAREAGPWNVRCNAVRPGMMDNERLTRIFARVAAERGSSPEAIAAEQLQFVSMRSKVSMSEVASMLHFLASDAAQRVTGQIIAVDGDCQWEG